GMIRDLKRAGYRGPIALRANPGFGHGHTQSCDTGGPSSKHGVWHEDLAGVQAAADEAGFPIVSLHVHVGTGPQPGEFEANMRRVADVYAELVPRFPAVRAVNFGGGIPHPYRPDQRPFDLDNYRPIRVEIEPGRYAVAGMALLVARVTDVKETRSNEKGPGNRFVMVDAGFNDLV